VRVGQRQASKHAPREANQGFALVKSAVAPGASRLFAPMISVDPGPVAAPRTSGYGSGASGTRVVAPLVAVVDQTSEELLTDGLATETSASQRDCLLPRAATAQGATLWVACLSIDAVLRSPSAIRSSRRRRSRCRRPVGLAATPAALLVGRRSPRDRARSAARWRDHLPLARRLRASVDCARRELFHATKTRTPRRTGAPARLSPDGRDDGSPTAPTARRARPRRRGRGHRALVFGETTDQAPPGPSRGWRTGFSHRRNRGLRS
jgi:hypothetical protein